MAGNIVTRAAKVASRRGEDSLSVTVLRACPSCGEPNTDPLATECARCHGPAGAVERRGIVAYYHPNPLRRWAWHVRNWLRSR